MEENNVSLENKKKQNPILFVGIATVAIILVATYLLARGQREKISQGVNESETQTQNIAAQNSSVTEPAEESGVKIFEITGGAYFFKPNEIRVKKGEKVRIVFTNSDGIHDLVIDELNVKTKLVQSGETVEIEFVADEVGEFVYYCSVANHRSLGVKGTLIVE